MEKLCTNKNHSYKHNEQIKKQNIDNSECFGVTLVKIYPEMTSQSFFLKIWFGWLCRDFFYISEYFWQMTVYITLFSKLINVTKVTEWESVFKSIQSKYISLH